MRIFLALLLGFLSSQLPAQEATRISPAEQAKTLLAEIVEDYDGPGVQYVVVDSGRTIFEYAGGWADIEGQTPLTLETPMMAYSMTKTLTAAAALKLMEAGKLRLDDSADDYLKGSPYGKAITIRHLLTHTSGIPNPIPLRWVHPSLARWDSSDETAALHEQLSEHAELDFAPGEEGEYSNLGYWLLGYVIQAASGMEYKSYVTKEIFGPLGLSERDMSFSIPDGTNAAKGYLARWTLINLFKYFFVDSELVGEYENGWLHVKAHYVNGPSFGGIIGTARGFGTFLQDQLRTESALFGRETRTLFFETAKKNSGENTWMTHGWHIGTTENDVRYFFKEGGGGGFHSEMRIYPDRGIGTVIMVNETSSKAKDFLTELDELFLK